MSLLPSLNTSLSCNYIQYVVDYWQLTMSFSVLQCFWRRLFYKYICLCGTLWAVACIKNFNRFFMVLSCKHKCITLQYCNYQAINRHDNWQYTVSFELSSTSMHMTTFIVGELNYTKNIINIVFQSIQKLTSLTVQSSSLVPARAMVEIPNFSWFFTITCSIEKLMLT